MILQLLCRHEYEQMFEEKFEEKERDATYGNGGSTGTYYMRRIINMCHKCKKLQLTEKFIGFRP